MKYERLTKRYKEKILVKGYEEYFVDQECPRCFKDGCFYAGKILDRLAELEDKIEDGELVELPCKIGDTVYEPILGMPILEWEVESITYNTVYPKGVLWLRQKYNGMDAPWKFWGEDFGKKIFITRAEAEAKLKELKGE